MAEFNNFFQFYIAEKKEITNYFKQSLVEVESQP
jgi:hypothetical protein